MPTCVPWGLDSTCCDEWGSLPRELRERAEDLAWSTLRTLTGGRVGSCAVTMRPCLGPPCDLCLGVEWMHPHIRDGVWLNRVCGTPRCTCKRLCEIVFPGPIAALVSVTLDGDEVPLTALRVDNGNRLVRTDGECWPSCQDMGVAPDAPGSLTIEYVPGIVPSDAGLWAAGTLACEFAKACSGDKCRLPSSVTAVARQGVSFTLSTGMFADGMTGIREVDAYLVSINPNSLRIPPMVWSPDVPWAGHRWPSAIAEVTP